MEWLTLALQVTRFDADAFARQEQLLRKNHRKHSIEFARAHTNNAAAYRFIKNKEQKIHQDVPDTYGTKYTLCRSQKDLPVVRIDHPIAIPSGATVQTDSTTVVSQWDDKLKLTNVQGPLPTTATLCYTTHAYHIDRMSHIFQHFWSQFWQRDLPTEQLTNDVWQDLFTELQSTIPQQPPLQIVLDDPTILWATIKRMKTHKAIGADGWYSEELHQLTWHMIVDLSSLLTSMWSHGLTTQQMHASPYPTFCQMRKTTKHVTWQAHYHSWIPLSFVFHHRLRTPQLRPYAYADNWSFMTIRACSIQGNADPAQPC